jgi:hypothetical protein
LIFDLPVVVAICQSRLYLNKISVANLIYRKMESLLGPRTQDHHLWRPSCPTDSGAPKLSGSSRSFDVSPTCLQVVT